jgi:threonine dehydratase
MSDMPAGRAGLQRVELAGIRAAHKRIAAFIHRTPVISSSLLNRHCDCELHFKCENLQKVGAFKARGALNAVLGLDASHTETGVATHSSGNHGAALAMAAAVRGMPARIVMPANAPDVKMAAVRGYGGEIVECEPTLAAREETLAELVARHGSHVIHPYDDPRIVAGQGTVGLELLEQLADVEVVVAPVGGGGLIGGLAVAIKSLRPEIELVAAEPAGADDAFRSFRLGYRVPQEDPRTIADGLLTSLGELNYAIIRERVDDILTVGDESIIEAMQLQWTRLKSVVEPSGAVSFAAVLEHPQRFRGRCVACVISGGNVDLTRLPWS